MSAYVYVNSEPGLWTVGFDGADGKWNAESDHTSEAEAAKRVHYLNGGNPGYDEATKALRSAVKTAGGMYLMSASAYESAIAAITKQ